MSRFFSKQTEQPEKLTPFMPSGPFTFFLMGSAAFMVLLLPKKKPVTVGNYDPHVAAKNVEPNDG